MAIQRGNMVINHGFWLGLPTYFHGKKRCFRSRNTLLSLIPVAFANYPSVPWSRLLWVSIVMVGSPFIAGWFNVENGTSIHGWWNWSTPPFKNGFSSMFRRCEENPNHVMGGCFVPRFKWRCWQQWCCWAWSSKCGHGPGGPRWTRPAERNGEVE